MTLMQAKRRANKAFRESGRTHLVAEFGGPDYQVLEVADNMNCLKIVHIACPPELRISISEGNRKMGYIPSISFPPDMTCAGLGRPCFEDGECYAMRNMYDFRPTIAKAWDRNWHIWDSSPDLYWAHIACYLNTVEPPNFRFFVGGGCPSQEYFNSAAELMARYPKTKALMFDKGYDIGIDYSPAPPNLAVVLSMWPGMDVPSEDYADMPRSWIEGDPRAPRNGVECAGHCWNCGMCWNLRKLGRDVILHKH